MNKILINLIYDILLKSLEKDLFYLFDNVYYQKNDDYRIELKTKDGC